MTSLRSAVGAATTPDGRCATGEAGAQGWVVDVGDAVVVGVDGLRFVDPAVGAVTEPQDDRGQQRGRERAGEDGDLDVVVRVAARAERQFADEQGDGEPDTAEDRQPEDVDPGEALRRGSRG